MMEDYTKKNQEGGRSGTIATTIDDNTTTRLTEEDTGTATATKEEKRNDSFSEQQRQQQQQCDGECNDNDDDEFDLESVITMKVSNVNKVINNKKTTITKNLLEVRGNVR